MPLRRGKRRLFAALVAVLAGTCAAVALASNASASGAFVWTAYDLSNQTGQTATGLASLLPEPQHGDQQAVTDSAGGGIIQFGGDGASGANGYNITSEANNGSSVASGSPSAIKDPQTGDFLIFTTTGSSGSDLTEYDRNATSFVWQPYDISSAAGGQQVNDTPSAIVPSSGVLTVAALAPGYQLNAFTRDPSSFDWSVTDVSQTDNRTVQGAPEAWVDPDGGYPEIYAWDTSNDLVEFFNEGSGWQVVNLSTSYGGQTISSNPAAVDTGGQVQVLAEAPGGDLIDFSRTAAGWSSQNLTTLTGGATISGQPAVVADPDGGIDVFAQGANGSDLVEYSGSGSSWAVDNLATTDDAPAMAAAPTATISSTNGLVAVYYTDAADHLIEFERSAAAPAPATTTTTTSSTATPSTGTSTVVTSPTPPSPTKTKPGAKKQLKVKVLTDWKWAAKRSELEWIKLGKLSEKEGLSFTCRGTGNKKTTGCPYKTRSATGKKAVAKLVRKTAKSRYGVGVVLTMTISETGDKSETAEFTIRKSRAPKVSL